MKVYQIWYETNIGPTFSSLEEAQVFLDKRYQPDDWKQERAENGYPDIEEIIVGDEEFYRDR